MKQKHPCWPQFLQHVKTYCMSMSVVIVHKVWKEIFSQPSLEFFLSWTVNHQQHNQVFNHMNTPYRPIITMGIHAYVCLLPMTSANSLRLCLQNSQSESIKQFLNVSSLSLNQVKKITFIRTRNQSYWYIH